MTDNNHIAAVEHALAVFSSSVASASEFRASAEAARAAVRAFDAKNESARIAALASWRT